MEKEGEPGSARFGNFINYYQFNPAERRLSIVPNDFCCCLGSSPSTKKIHILDIGCNSGDLTTALYEKICNHKTRSSQKTPASLPDPEVKVLGVDLDPSLIKRCDESNKHPDNVTYLVADIMDQDPSRHISDYMQKHAIQTFDLVTCFSVTMWIHLNHGDQGLRTFLGHVSGLGQALLVEPQPWKCYRSAVRRMSKLDCDPFPQFQALQWRKDVEKEVMDFVQTSCDMELIRTFGTTKWSRSLSLYQRPKINN